MPTPIIVELHLTPDVVPTRRVLNTTAVLAIDTLAVSAPNAATWDELARLCTANAADLRARTERAAAERGNAIHAMCDAHDWPTDDAPATVARHYEDKGAVVCVDCEQALTLSRTEGSPEIVWRGEWLDLVCPATSAPHRAQAVGVAEVSA